MASSGNVVDAVLQTLHAAEAVVCGEFHESPVGVLVGVCVEGGEIGDWWRRARGESEVGWEGDAGFFGEVCHGEVARELLFGGALGDPWCVGEETALVEGCVDGGERAAEFDVFDDDYCSAGLGAVEELEVDGEKVLLATGAEVDAGCLEDGGR